MTEKEKKKKIDEETAKIKSYFENVAESKRTIVSSLIQNAGFMKVTLDDLQERIIKDGVIDEYHNGATQYGTKQSATLQSYNALVKNYASVIKALCALLPKTDVSGKSMMQILQERMDADTSY